MKKSILLAGGTGLIGSRLLEQIDHEKYEIYVLSRSLREGKQVKFLRWDPAKEWIELNGLRPDIIINLAGAGIADKRWTKKRKKEIIDSRVSGANIFSKLISDGSIKPELYLSASAIGIYGDRADQVLNENTEVGDDSSFLVRTCLAWEDSANQLRKLVDRMLILRIGIVLSNKGGALVKMRLPLKTGIAGYFGNGKQYMPWIHIDDLCSIIIHLVHDPKATGVFNAVSPNPSTVLDFTKKLKQVFNPRSLVMSTPAIVLKTLMGEMSEMLLNSLRVVPRRMMDSGFNFKFEKLEEALEDLKERDV